MDSAAIEFSGALATLMTRAESTQQIRNEIEGLPQWDWLQTDVSSEGATSPLSARRCRNPARRPAW